MRLSIGMIVKNEEKYLERCLFALGRLRRDVDCELIIVDTGSTDSTVEIAKRFTDKVYHFEWCNDFAAARNETIKHATGEWYMALDADEIFVDTDELIRFMNSDERHNWVSASFKVKNLSTAQGQDIDTELVDVLRIIRRTDDLHYEGAIHEQFAAEAYKNGIPNCFRLNSVADHFGYIVDDGVLDKKGERNKVLLYGEFEERKNEAMYYTQLYDLEFGLKNYEKAAEHALRCIELSENVNEYENAVGYMLYLEALNILQKSDEVIRMADKYFAQKHTFEHLCDIPVYMNSGLAKFRKKDWHGAIADYEKYFELKQKRGDKITLESYRHAIRGLNDECFIIRFLECAVAYEQVGDAAGLSRLLKSVPPSTFDQKLTLEIDYARDYVSHAVLLAVQCGDRSAADYIAQNGTDRQRQLLREIIAEVTGNRAQQNEMEQYAAQIKDTIRTLINGGMKQQALQLIAQYKQLCPDDTEITKLEAMMNM